MKGEAQEALLAARFDFRRDVEEGGGKNGTVPDDPDRPPLFKDEEAACAVIGSFKAHGKGKSAHKACEGQGRRGAHRGIGHGSVR